MLWLAAHFPNLALESMQRSMTGSGSNTGGLPLVVLEHNRVAACNTVAVDQGIVPGTTLATAHSICPDLLYQEKDPLAEQQRLNLLADLLYRFSSHVSIQQPDCLLLEIGGSLRLFGEYKSLCTKVQALCQEVGHLSRIRVAQTPWAAVALARSGQKNLADVPLASAGIELVGVPAQLIERFDNMGIYTLGPLLELPSKQLGKRFGTALLYYIEMLTGLRADPRLPIHPPPDFNRSLHLLQPITDKVSLCQGPMRKLTGELQQWLITHQLGCTELSWRFSSNKHTTTLQLRFADPRQNAESMLFISELRLEQVALPDEVLSINLQLQQGQLWQNQSQTLFQLERRATQTHVSPFTLVDELNARLGDYNCKFLSTLDQHTPELAWCTGVSSNHSTRTTASISAHSAQKIDELPKRRPLWLFDPPYRACRQELQLLNGPERIQSNWWRTTTCRDYYVARHRSGAECWAFVDADGQWYLHGYFS